MVDPLPGSAPVAWQRSHASMRGAWISAAMPKIASSKRNFQIVAQILAPLRAGAAAAASAEQIAEAEEIAQDIAEIGKRAGIEALRRSSAGRHGRSDRRRRASARR